MRASSGRPKASVLPEPVAALPSTSRPASASGRAEVWMANGRWMPRRSRAVTSCWGRPSWWNVGPRLGAASRRCSRRGVLDSGVLGRVRLERRQGGSKSCGVGLRYSSERVPWKRRARGWAGVLTGDRLRPGVERGICTDALMPGQTVREDDRPMCRYAQVSSEDRSGDSPAGGGHRHRPAVGQPRSAAYPGRTTSVSRRFRSASGRKAAASARSVTVWTSSHDHPNVVATSVQLAASPTPRSSAGCRCSR